LLSNYNIKYICTIYTRLDTCLMSISRFSLREKVWNQTVLELDFWAVKFLFFPRRHLNSHHWYTAAPIVSLMSSALDHSTTSAILKHSLTHIWQLKDLILTLFGLIFRRIYIYIYIHVNLYWEIIFGTKVKLPYKTR
jgi:hypothetical protein